MWGRTEAPSFRVGVRTEHGRPVVDVVGELDVYTVPRLRAELVQLAEQGRHSLIVDLSETTFIDSSGIGVLVGAVKRATRHRGAVCVVGANDHMMKMFRIMGLTQFIPLFGDLESAFEHLELAYSGNRR